MYINSQFMYHGFDDSEIIINNNDIQCSYEFILNIDCYDVCLFFNFIFNFYTQKVKKFSLYLSEFFFKFHKKLKIKFKYNIKIKKRRKNKIKTRILTKDFLINQLSKIGLSFWKKRRKWLRIKKTSISKPMKTILKSRRVLKFMFKSFKLKSHVLTQKLLQFFTNKVANSKLLFFNCLGCLLLRSGIILNLKDVFFFLKIKAIKINNKSSNSFFINVSQGDIISFSNVLFFINYFWYFKIFANRWLQRKKRRHLLKFKKYVNFNKITTNINVTVKRWLQKSRFFLSKFSNFEVDYRFLSICVFTNWRGLIKKNLFSVCLNSIGILNTWYYNF